MVFTCGFFPHLICSWPPQIIGLAFWRKGCKPHCNPSLCESKVDGFRKRSNLSMSSKYSDIYIHSSPFHSVHFQGTFNQNGSFLSGTIFFPCESDICDGWHWANLNFWAWWFQSHKVVIDLGMRDRGLPINPLNVSSTVMVHIPWKLNLNLWQSCETHLWNKPQIELNLTTTKSGSAFRTCIASLGPLYVWIYGT